MNDQIRRPRKGNNSRAFDRRVREGFYEKYIVGKKGIDIGCAKRAYSISSEVQLWDLKTNPGGDATYMDSIDGHEYDYVLASHILEHLDDPKTAIKNWFRILKTGGHLIVCVPERDLFELKKELPSDFSRHHKWYFKLDQEDPPVTLSLKKIIKSSLPKNAKIEYIKVCDEKWNPEVKERTPKMTALDWPQGEFQIEAVIKKIKLRG